LALYHGKDARLYIAGYDVSPMTSKIGIGIEVPMAQYAVQDSTNAYHVISGIPKSDLDLDAVFDDNYMDQFNTLWGLTGGYNVLVCLGSNYGSRAYGGNSTELASYQWKSVITDVNRLTAKLHVETIPWEECILAFPKTQETADGDGTIIDNLGTSTNGLTAYLQVFECGSDDALVVKVQTSSSAGFTSPTDKITFTTANGITAERKTVAGTIQRYLRIDWSGAAPYQATFAVAIKR
jgi:hypothetical protein